MSVAMPGFDAITALKMLNAFVSITRFNKGEAGKIIEEVKTDGIKVIVKNNVPECVMLTVEEYDALATAANRKISISQDKETETKRKSFIEQIRQNAQTPMKSNLSLSDRKKLLDSLGPINIDEDAVNELRSASII